MCSCALKIDPNLWLHLTSAHNAPPEVTKSDDEQATRWHERHHAEPGDWTPQARHAPDDLLFW